MIVDMINSYLGLEEDDMNSPTTCSEEEEKIETAMSEICSKSNQLQERFVSLKTLTETMREQIQKEKELWAEEVRATVELERQMRDRHDWGSGDKFAVTNETDYKTKYERFKDFLSFANSNSNLEDYVRKNDYKKTLFDVETKCNMELLKIQHSITMLKPLKEMAARWITRRQPESGDQIGNGLQEMESTGDNLKEQSVHKFQETIGVNEEISNQQTGDLEDESVIENELDDEDAIRRVLQLEC